MKIIHTADWHIGQSFHGHNRADEHLAALRQVRKACEEHRPDALVIAGDIFDNDHPSAADCTLLASALAEIHRALPAMHIIATAGNHDSPSRHMSHAPVYEAVNAHMAGRATADTADSLILDIGSGIVVALPFYISPSLDTEELAREARRRADGRPTVVMAHNYVTGSDITGHSLRRDTVGGQEAVTPDCFAPDGSYDYLALGHIHRPQWVDRDRHIRYSGSLLQVSFDETYSHTLSLVEIDSRGETPRLTELTVEPVRPAVTIPATGALPLDEALDALAKLPDDLDCYVRLNILTDSALPPTAGEDARRLVADKKARLCYIATVRPEAAAAASAATKSAVSVDELRRRDPGEMISLYNEIAGITLDDGLTALLNDVINSLEQHPDDETA